jgi:hypothetical protein
VQSLYWRNFVCRLERTTGLVVLANSVPDALTEIVSRPSRTVPVCLFIAGTEAVRKGIDEIFDAMHALMQRKVKVNFQLLAVSPPPTAHDVLENVLLSESNRHR